MNIETITTIYQSLVDVNIPIFGCGFDNTSFIIVIGRNLPQYILYIGDYITFVTIFPLKVEENISFDKIKHNLVRELVG